MRNTKSRKKIFIINQPFTRYYCFKIIFLDFYVVPVFKSVYTTNDFYF